MDTKDTRIPDIASKQSWTIDDIRERQNRSLHNALTDGFDSHNYETDSPVLRQVTLEEIVLPQNKAHNALADGFERSDYLSDTPAAPFVSLDEVIMHQNRILHNVDGFRSEDYYQK